jgi:hypothetical protein
MPAHRRLEPRTSLIRRSGAEIVSPVLLGEGGVPGIVSGCAHSSVNHEPRGAVSSNAGNQGVQNSIARPQRQVASYVSTVAF